MEYKCREEELLDSPLYKESIDGKTHTGLAISVDHDPLLNIYIAFLPLTCFAKKKQAGTSHRTADHQLTCSQSICIHFAI